MSTSFENMPENHPTPGFYEKLSRRITELRARLQAHYKHAFPGLASQIDRAIDEAEAAAWCTPFPHLFLPELAEMQVARITR